LAVPPADTVSKSTILVEAITFSPEINDVRIPSVPSVPLGVELQVSAVVNILVADPSFFCSWMVGPPASLLQ